MTSDPYGLDPEFERVVLWYCATNVQFWSQVGHVLDPDSLGDPVSKLLLQTTRQLAKEMSQGPGSTLLVLQRLRRRLGEGKVTQADIQAVSDLFDSVEDRPGGLPDPDLVKGEILPVLQRRIRSQAILLAHDEYAKHGDFSGVRDLLEKADGLGAASQISGARLGPAGFDRIVQARNVSKLPTGVFELDLQLNGGWVSKSLFVWMGDSGQGKSQALVHQTCEGLRQRLFCGFVTLELPEHIQFARLFANLTGLDVNDILDITHVRDEAAARLAAIESKIGLCEVAEFPPGVTTVRDLRNWIDSQEQKHGIKMRLLVVDYGDKLHAPELRGIHNEYLAGKYIHEGLRRDIGVARDMWVSTASQVRRPDKDSGKLLDLRHVADSVHKVRVPDYVVTLNPREEGMEYFIAKNRLDKSRITAGPLPTDFVRARLCPITKELGDW